MRAPLFPNDGSRLNIVDREKAQRLLGTLESVTVYMDRHRGMPASSNWFVCFQEPGGQKPILWIEPENKIETIDALKERIQQEKKKPLTFLIEGLIDHDTLTLASGDDTDLYKLLARAFGSDHKNGVVLGQFRNARMPNGRTVGENVEQHYLRYARY